MHFQAIFETARLINCGHFMSMVLNDYLAGFLGNAAHGHSWHMKPFNKIHRLDGTEVGRGEGNNVSVEFNLLYRWHATISEADDRWTSKMMSHIFGGRTDWQNITVDDYMKVVHDPHSPLIPTGEPRVRDIFPGMNIPRQKDGSYKDEDIARIIQNATSEPAHRYGARATPSSLRIIEVMTIMQGRKWGVCTMNEFRQCMGLKKFNSFEDWNSDPEIANAARQLYQHIDRLELYAGLQAEETMELRPGSGFCIGYTTMRAILADAICLIRGDRFFTTDFTPGNLTAWGFGDVEPVQDNGAFAACLPKLLLRHLPDNYTYNSVYGLFPFFTPESMKKSLTNQGVVTKYDFSAPKTLQPVVVLETLQSIRTVFDDFERFKVTYTDDMKVSIYHFFLLMSRLTRLSS
jgi:linoleate 10R-lipoxygenase